MTATWVGFPILASFVVGSLAYVYKFRGKERFQDFAEYVSKGWPIFSPLNCLLYLFTEERARKPIMDVKDFPELNKIQENWTTIREEALKLYQQNHFDSVSKQDNASYYDIGFRTFYKYGWSKFYLKWYGYTHNSALQLCPKTVEILKDIPTVNGAMFSILPAGSQLTRHLDPVACSLRYHLGLATPNSTDCYINVDGQSYSWKDGEAFIFDETYLHYVKNNTDNYRIILMCDIERPLFIIGSVFNFLFKSLMRMTVVPNLEGDRRGLVNSIFSSLSPILAKTKTLKQTNVALYKAIKYTVNTILFLIIVAILWAVFLLVGRFF